MKKKPTNRMVRKKGKPEEGWLLNGTETVAEPRATSGGGKWGKK